MNFYDGSCHCGNITFSMHSEKHVSEFNPRKCDCNFCLKHGCMFVSDPEGSVDIRIKNTEALNKYRQGSGLAEMFVCKQCGVAPLFTFEHENGLYAVLNALCFDSNTGFGDTVEVSPKKLGNDEKIRRWLTLWIPDVRIQFDNV